MLRFRAMIFGIATALAAACASGSYAADVLTIVGTGDGVAMLKAVGEAFSQANPAVTVAVPESIGSTGGIKAVGTGEHKIGRIAREIRDTEKSYNLSYLPFAKIPVVFFVHKSVSEAALTRQQIADIYAGKVSNWKEVGGPDLRVRVVRREDGDSSLSALQKQLPEFKAIEITNRSKTTVSTGENVETVESNAGAIGFGPYTAGMESKFGVVKLDGKTALETGYPVYVTLALIYKSEGNAPAIQQFVEFVKTPAAQAVIKGADAIPF
jgi:phosphate transport system substrate-binding protein